MPNVQDVDADGAGIDYTSAKPFLFWGAAFVVLGVALYFGLFAFAADVPPALAGTMATGGLYISAVLVGMGSASVLIGALRGTARTTPADGFTAGEFGGAAAVFVVVLSGFVGFVPQPEPPEPTVKEVAKNGTGRVSITMQHWTSEQWAAIHPDLEGHLVEKDIEFLQSRPALHQGALHTTISPISLRPDGTYEFVPVQPQPGEVLLGHFKRRVQQSELGGARLEAALPQAQLCFRVPLDKLEELELLGFQCPENGDCGQRTVLNDGGVEMCGSPTAASLSDFLSIGAHAFTGGESTPEAIRAAPRWVVPDLRQQCELAAKGYSFTLFTVEETLEQWSADVDVYSYDLRVNDVPILVGGFSGDEIRIQIPEDRRLDLRFALGNLNFSGANYGYEDMQVRLRFFKYDAFGRETEVNQCTLRRQYTALRQAPAVSVQCKEVDQRFSWSGDYVLGQERDGYEVFVWSSPDKQEIAEKRERLNRAGLAFAGQQVVGVLRPPLGDNTWYALALGLKRPSHHIGFTFPQENADEILDWVLSEETQKTRVRGRWGDLNRVLQADSRLEPLTHGYRPEDVGCPVREIQLEEEPIESPSKDAGCAKIGAVCPAAE